MEREREGEGERERKREIGGVCVEATVGKFLVGKLNLAAWQ